MAASLRIDRKRQTRLPANWLHYCAWASQDKLSLREDLCFIDDGYWGTTLIRPALDRLRDAAAAGILNRLYIHSPDRLARKYAYQVLLVDEFHAVASRWFSSTDRWMAVPKINCCSRCRA